MLMYATWVPGGTRARLTRRIARAASSPPSHARHLTVGRETKVAPRRSSLSARLSSPSLCPSLSRHSLTSHRHHHLDHQHHAARCRRPRSVRETPRRPRYRTVHRPRPRFRRRILRQHRVWQAHARFHFRVRSSLSPPLPTPRLSHGGADETPLARAGSE